MRNGLEIFFRRQRHFLLLLVLLPLIGLAVGFALPRTYQSSASLWAVRRYNIADGTWAAKWYEMLGLTASSPAVAESGVLTELLNTRSFAVQIGSSTGLMAQLPDDVRSDPIKTADALFQEISKKVKVSAGGDNLVIINYANQDPNVAQQVVAATIQSFTTASQQLALNSAQELLTSYQAQLAQLQTSAQQTEADLASYLSKHPGLAQNRVAQATDPTYLELSSQAVDAEQSLASMESNIGLLNLQITTIGSQPDAFFNVQDPATLPTKPHSLTTTLLLTGATGLAIALAICALYLAILMRRNRVAYSSAELKSALSIPVLLQIPQVAIEQTAAARLLLVASPPIHLAAVQGRELAHRE